MIARGYQAPVACAAAGITYRQLDYWARTEIVLPSVSDGFGRGSQRLYSRDDMVRLAVVRALLDAGLSLTAARENLDAVLRDNEAMVGEHVQLRIDTGAVTRRVDQTLTDVASGRPLLRLASGS